MKNNSYSKETKIKASISRRANAPIKSFFSHFKSELIYLSKTNNYNNLILEMFEYIDYYNNKRIQKKLRGLSSIFYGTKTP